MVGVADRVIMGEIEMPIPLTHTHEYITKYFAFSGCKIFESNSSSLSKRCLTKLCADAQRKKLHSVKESVA